MGLNASILTARVHHRRLQPRSNAFGYGVWYLAVPVSLLDERHGSWRFGVNRPALTSLRALDHGPRDGSSPRQWLDGVLSAQGLDTLVDEVVLVTMPRVLGYGFNPVSFWLCLDRQRGLRAVLCEVNNTFGETHCYLCAHADRRPILRQDRLRAEKLFHVSPFFDRTGSYEFRFYLSEDQFGAWINLFDEAGDRQLVTSLTGTMQPLTPASLRNAFWAHKLVPLKALLLIHWQALRLALKGMRYLAKPEQLATRLSVSRDAGTR